MELYSTFKFKTYLAGFLVQFMPPPKEEENVNDGDISNGDRSEKKNIFQSIFNELTRSEKISSPNFLMSFI